MRTRLVTPVKLAPITDADTAAVADFLHANFDERVPWARSYMSLPWKVDAPNHGFMLRDGQRVVGAYLAFYSDRLVAGRVERFCNLGAWCVLPEYRFHSVRLLKALLAQDGYHFTDLSPNKTVESVNARFKFRHLDTSAVFVPHLPWLTVPGRTKISADPDVIADALTGPDLELYRDHAQAPAAHHLLATMAELRTIRHRPYPSFKLNSWPKMYRSATLEPGQIDDLYSELVCVPW
jgi:hypothetical protein